MHAQAWWLIAAAVVLVVLLALWWFSPKQENLVSKKDCEKICSYTPPTLEQINKRCNRLYPLPRKYARDPKTFTYASDPETFMENASCVNTETTHIYNLISMCNKCKTNP